MLINKNNIYNVWVKQTDISGKLKFIKNWGTKYNMRIFVLRKKGNNFYYAQLYISSYAEVDLHTYMSCLYL